MSQSASHKDLTATTGTRSSSAQRKERSIRPISASDIGHLGIKPLKTKINVQSANKKRKLKKPSPTRNLSVSKKKTDPVQNQPQTLSTPVNTQIINGVPTNVEPISIMTKKQKPWFLKNLSSKDLLKPNEQEVIVTVIGQVFTKALNDKILDLNESLKRANAE